MRIMSCEHLSGLSHNTYIRRPHKGRCSEPRRAPKCSQGRPLCALGKVKLVQRPIGHNHAISGRLGHMRMCTSAYACPKPPGLRVCPFQFQGQLVYKVLGNKISSYKKQDFLLQETRQSWSGVWLRRGLLYTHTQRDLWQDSFSA